MHETYRMLAREHDADLEREAARRRLAAQLPRSGRLRMGSVLALPHMPSAGCRSTAAARRRSPTLQVGRR
jgi:hypothetical protein